MSTVIYGSASQGTTINGYVVITRADVKYWREPLFDARGNYLVTRHLLDCTGIVNPEINAMAFSGGFPTTAIPGTPLAAVRISAAGRPPLSGGYINRLASILNKGGGVLAPATGPVGFSGGVTASFTDLAVRHILSQSQQQLIYAIGDVPVLVSPGVNTDGTAATVDARNGPAPLAYDVKTISGTKTMIVSFKVETFVNEASLFVATPSVMLSNTWTKRNEIDSDWYETVITEGTAHYRADRLLFLGNVPSDYRAYLVHPVPTGFQRVGWEHIPSDDGTMLHYRYIDKQTHLRIAAAGITRIEAEQTVSTRANSLERAVAKGLIAASSAAGKRKSTLKGSIATGFFAAGMEAIPVTEIEVNCRVWGADATVRKTLETFGVGLVRTRLAMSLSGLPVAATVLAGSELEVTHDLNGTFVEVSASMFSSLTAFATIAPTFGITATFPSVNRFFPSPPAVGGNDATPGFLLRDGLPRNDLPVEAAPGFRGLAGSRSRFLGELATSTLVGPNNVPFGGIPIVNGVVATPP